MCEGGVWHNLHENEAVYRILFCSLLEHIHFSILVEIRKVDHDDIFDHGGIRSFADKYKTIQYIIIPEIFTEFLMEEQSLSYKEAMMELYNRELPTTHHVKMLLNDSVVNCTTIQSGKHKITVQLVEGDISKQLTHCSS